MTASTVGLFQTLRRRFRLGGMQVVLGAAVVSFVGQAGAQPPPPEPEKAPPAAPEPAAPPEGPARPDAPAAPREAPPSPDVPPEPADADAATKKTDGEVAGDVADAKTEGDTAEVDVPAIDYDPGAQAPLADDEERAVPDYDGRGEDPVTAGEALLWIPRGLLFPVYLVSEYVIRWPLGKLTAALDEADIPGILGDFFTFGPGDSFGLVPSFLIDFGFRPSIGAYFFGDDVGGVEGLGIRSHLAFGGVDFYRGTGTVRYTINDSTKDQPERFVQIKGIYSHRPDWRFYGIGSDTRDDDSSRYGSQTIDGVARYEGGFWRTSHIYAWGGVRDTAYKNLTCCDDIVIRDAVAQGRYALPDLFDDGYLTGFGGLDVSLDTREVRVPPLDDASDFVQPTGTGLKLNARGEIFGGLRDTVKTPTSNEGRLGWIRYGGTIGGFLDVYKQRVFGLQGIVDFADPLDPDGQIPFSELVSLGGSRPMRGFLAQRLLGRSSAVAELSYRWPIWVSLDGEFVYNVGNVFGEHLEDFDLDKLRQSFGFGFSAAGSRDHTFELLLALGTETFEQGSSIDTFRFVFGSSAGF